MTQWCMAWKWCMHALPNVETVMNIGGYIHSDLCIIVMYMYIASLLATYTNQ